MHAGKDHVVNRRRHHRRRRVIYDVWRISDTVISIPIVRIIATVAIGSLIAGILIGASISIV